MLVLFLATTLTVAQTPLSLAGALSLADRNASVHVARAQADLHQLQVDTARAPSSPILALGTTRYAAREVVSVTQDIRWAGERRYAVRAAQGLADSAGANANRVVREARRLIRQAWFALATAEDAEALGSEASSRATEVAAIVRARFEGGRAPRLDLVRAEAEASRLAASTQALTESRRAAWARLATLVGLDPAAEESTDHVRPAALGEEMLSMLATATALDGHPVVQVAALSLASATASREMERRRLLPGLSLTLGVNADVPGLPGPDRPATRSLTLPFGKRGLVALRVAEAEVRVQTAQLEAARRDLRAALVVASHRLRGARAQLVVYDREALPAAEEAARLTREAYEAGRGDVLRVVDTERALLDVRSARLQAYADVKSGEADLLAAAARENE